MIFRIIILLAIFLISCGNHSSNTTDKLCFEELELSTAECEKAIQLAMPNQLPLSPGNNYADDEDAAFFGFRMFYDMRLSNIPEVRCATCHQPELYFTDGKPVSEVISDQPGIRNSLSILTAAWIRPFFFWDGRADSLWSQPLFAFEHPNEMNSSRLKVAHAVFNDPEYKKQYEMIFGNLPPLDDTTRFPLEGKPGDSSFDNMNEPDKDLINRVIANIGKAIEAYMRKAVVGPGNLEEYISGDKEALSEASKQGLKAFIKSGCINCHSGPALSDGKFYRIGTKTNEDSGRAGAINILKENPFNLNGPYSDYSDGENISNEILPADEGAFRTPSLRVSSFTAPYGHAGQYESLKDLLNDHGPQIDSKTINDLQVFLLTLDFTYPQRPWGDWPVL